MENISPISDYLQLIEKTKNTLANIVVLMNLYKNDLERYKSLCNEYLILCSSIHTYTDLIKDEIRRNQKRASDIMNKLYQDNI